MGKLVSVIVPIFQVEALVAECLTSILDQDYPNIEIICVNDATNDNSMGIVAALQEKDERVAVLYHGVNQGLGASRNTGLRHARGEYIKFVDSDDKLLPSSIRTLVDCLDNSDVDFCFSALSSFDGATTSSRSPFHSARSEKAGANGLIDFAADPTLLNEMWPSAWLPLWRADRIARSGAVFPEGTAFEDHEFFFKHGFDIGRAAYIPAPLYRYTYNRPGQITRDPARVFDVFPVIERLQNLFRTYLRGEQLIHVSARNALRLVCERTWALAPGEEITRTYYRQAAEFLLSRFPRKVLHRHKDEYISEDEFARLIPRRLVILRSVRAVSRLATRGLRPRAWR